MSVDDLIELINRSTQHRYLYHFTDEVNLPSISALGLLSKESMRAQNLWPDAPGGNELSWQLDRRKGIFGYVSLCFTQNHPMKFVCQRDGRLPNPRYLAISPEVLRIPEIRVAFGIANGEGVEIVGLGQALDQMDVEVIYTRTDWSIPAIQARLRVAERYELLVPGTVPRHLIVGKY